MGKKQILLIMVAVLVGGHVVGLSCAGGVAAEAEKDMDRPADQDNVPEDGDEEVFVKQS